MTLREVYPIAALLGLLLGFGAYTLTYWLARPYLWLNGAPDSVSRARVRG